MIHVVYHCLALIYLAAGTASPWNGTVQGFDYSPTTISREDHLASGSGSANEYTKRNDTWCYGTSHCPHISPEYKAESYGWSKLSVVGSRTLQPALEAFGFLMLKYAFFYILETLFLSSWHLVQHQKVRTLINLRYFYVIPPFANLHFLIIMKKLCLWLFDLRRYAKQSEARKFYDISTENR